MDKNNMFTPGPWEWVSDMSGLWQEDDVGAPGKMIMGVFCEGMISDLESDPTMDRNQGPNKANANLIAAAPDLLETLQDILSIIEIDGQASWGDTPEDGSIDTYVTYNMHSIKEDIKSVIAKAMGAAK
tara:strand:+ start:574 stop:957 length:384 start_codon:yes stop_codon:yes gene_type:complete